MVLFDEVEKAHADIFNSLLQILEDGRLTDSQGRMVDFKNTVIIMTTNLGTRDIAKGLQTGFQAGGDLSTSYERMKIKVNDELKQHFRPEFLNRVDDVVVFPQLTQAEIIQIVDLMIAKLDERLRDKDMGIELTQKAKDHAGHQGLRPRARRPSAASHDPARHRGRAVREDPLRRAQGRRDRPGRRRGRGQGHPPHLHRVGEGDRARRRRSWR